MFETVPCQDFSKSTPRKWQWRRVAEKKKSFKFCGGVGEGGRFCSLMCVGSIALALDIDGIVTALVACPNCNTSPRAAKVFVKQNN